MNANYCYIVAIIIINCMSFNLSGQNEYILSQTDLTGYKLSKEAKSVWKIEHDSIYKKGVIQKWEYAENKFIYVDYCTFNNDISAVKGIAYNANSYSIPFIVGSVTGKLFGELCWTSIDGSAFCFLKNNNVVKIFMPLGLSSDSQLKMQYIADEISKKIDSNASKDVIAAKNNYLLNLSNQKEFQKKVSICKKTLIAGGYKETQNDVSKWLISKDSLTMGFRQQWIKGDSTIFSVDIAEFADPEHAQAALLNRGEMFKSDVFDFDNKISKSEIIEKLKNKYKAYKVNNSFSVLGRKNNLVIQIFCYKNRGVDFKEFDKVIAAIEN